MLLNIKRDAATIQKYEYISFDIFDTLIKRNVAHPTDVFTLTEARYNTSSSKTTLFDFKQMRRQAERLVRAMRPGEEVSLQEIYNEMEMPASEKEILMQLEINIEIEACVKNETIYSLYQECLRLKKKVIIVSDMYLPKAIIEKILHKNGYTGYDKLYLSSEIGLKKSDGMLWQYILKELAVPARKIWHIGDSVRSDVLRPMQNGICVSYLSREAIHTHYLSQKQIFESSFESGLVYSFINNRLPSYADEGRAFQLGYELLGPLIFGFCEWIHEQAVDNKLDKLFFLARDCYIIIQAYQKMFANESIEAEYIYFSRASLRLPYLLSTKDVKKLQHGFARAKYELRQLFEGLLLNPEDYLAVCEQEGLCLSSRLRPGTVFRYKKISDALMEGIEEKHQSLELLLAYLRQVGLENNVGVIDVGWHGSIQYMLDEILEKNHVAANITGLYCGYGKRKSHDRNINAHGYWFREKDEDGIQQQLAIVYILEIMLFPPEGTTLAYYQSGDKVEPKIAQCEKYPVAWVKSFQEGALQFIIDYNSARLTNKAIPSATAKEPYFLFACHPKLCDAKEIGDFEFEDLAKRHLAKPKSKIFYLFQPNRFIEDYRCSKWKEGFLKRLFPFGIDSHLIPASITSLKLFVKCIMKGMK